MTDSLAWLIDTNVVSEMMRPRPEPQVAAFLDSIEHEGVGIASVTVWEILDGIGRLFPAGDEQTLLDDLTIYSTNCSTTASWNGPWRTPGRVHGSWRTSVAAANLLTTTFPMPFSLPWPRRAISPW